MAEGRMLKRTVASDRRLAQLSPGALTLFLMSIPHLDREGRMPGSPVAVRGSVVPALAEAQPNDWTDDLVASYITEWTGVTDEDDGGSRPLVLHYCVRGVWACQFVGFKKNQRIHWDRERPSSLPEPPSMLLEELAGDAVSPGQLVLDATPGENRSGTVPITAMPFAEPDPDLIRKDSGPEVKAEAQVQEQPPEQRPLSRTRAEEKNPAALLEDSRGGGEVPDPLAGVVAGVERRRDALETHGPLGRLLEVLPDADAHTPAVLHALFDPLGEAAIETAREEILMYGSEVRRPSAYAVGIGRRLAEEAAGAPGRRRRRGVREFASLRDERASIVAEARP